MENIDSSEATNAQQIVTAGQNVEVSALKCDKCSLSSSTLKKNDCLPCDCRNFLLEDQKSEVDRHCKNLMDESQLNGDFQLITDSSVNSVTNVDSSHNEIDLNDETNQINPTDSKLTKSNSKVHSSEEYRSDEGHVSSNFWICMHCTLENYEAKSAFISRLHICE